MKQPNYRLSLSKSSVLYQGCSLVNRWGRDQTKVMSKSMVKMDIKRWIKEEIPVKPQQSRTGRRRQGIQARRQIQRNNDRINRRENDDAAQPRIDAMFQMMREKNPRIARRQSDDQEPNDDQEEVQHNDPSERSSQLMGRPPDLQNLRTP